MKKALIFTLTAILSLCLTACGPAEQIEPSPLPSEEIIEPSPAEETWTPPPVTPTPAPRTAEEVLPPVEKDIFEGRDDIVYAQSISAGPAGLTVILADGSLLSRGENMTGTRSDPDMEGFGKVLDTGDNFNYISCAQFDTFAIDENDVLWGWGAVPGWGNITGIKPGDPSPYKLLTDVQMASTGAGTYLALRKDGSVWVWGNGENGALGNGPKSKEYSRMCPLTEPVMLFENAIYASFSGSGRVIKEDNSLWVWGYMGKDPETGESVCYDRPVHIMDDVSSAFGCFAVKTDGTLWALNSHWNAPPEERKKSYYYQEDPVLVMDNVKFAWGGIHYMVIKNDGSLWVWGDNTNGALGDGTENYIAEPMKLMDNVVWADSEMNGIYALKANGELWEMGRPYRPFHYLSDDENAPTKEEFFLSCLPHKMLDGVLVK